MRTKPEKPEKLPPPPPSQKRPLTFERWMFLYPGGELNCDAHTDKSLFDGLQRLFPNGRPVRVRIEVLEDGNE